MVEYKGQYWEEYLSLPNTDGHRNVRLLSKEALKYFFTENSKEAVKNGTEESFVPENFEEITNEIFSLDNVFVSIYPCEYYFNKDGEFVAEYPTNTYRSLNPREIVDRIKERLEQQYVVYVYTYFGLLCDIVNGEEDGITIFDKDTKTYWWRMISKKETI